MLSLFFNAGVVSAILSWLQYREFTPHGILHSFTPLNIAPCDQHPFSEELLDLHFQEDSKGDSEEHTSDLQEVLFFNILLIW